MMARTTLTATSRASGDLTFSFSSVNRDGFILLELLQYHYLKLACMIARTEGGAVQQSRSSGMKSFPFNAH